MKVTVAHRQGTRARTRPPRPDEVGRPLLPGAGWPPQTHRPHRIDAKLADPELGTSPPEGPGTSWTDPPAIPPLADDVTLESPVLTAEPTGKAVIERILAAAAQSFRDPKFRAVLQVEGKPGFAAVMDEVVKGNVLQLIEIFTLDASGEVNEIRIFTRPWIVTADLRQGIRDHLNGLLGPEFWEVEAAITDSSTL